MQFNQFRNHRWGATIKGFLMASSVALALTGCVTTTPRISFDYFEQYPGGRHYHLGIDIDQSTGTPIVAAADGTVIRSQATYGYAISKAVTIDHGNEISTDYQHMDTVVVQRGQKVKRGEIIGTVGSTGSMGPGTNLETRRPHLHFELIKGASRQDPKSYIVGCFDPKLVYKPLDMVWPTGCP